MPFLTHFTIPMAFHNPDEQATCLKETFSLRSVPKFHQRNGVNNSTWSVSLKMVGAQSRVRVYNIYGCIIIDHASKRQPVYNVNVPDRNFCGCMLFLLFKEKLSRLHVQFAKKSALT